MKRMQEEEVKGPPELISNNPKEIGSSDDSDQVQLKYFKSYIFKVIVFFHIFLLGRRRRK